MSTTRSAFLNPVVNPNPTARTTRTTRTPRIPRALREQLAAGAREAGRRLPDWPTQAGRFAAVLDAMP